MTIRPGIGRFIAEICSDAAEEDETGVVRCIVRALGPAQEMVVMPAMNSMVLVSARNAAFDVVFEVHEACARLLPHRRYLLLHAVHVLGEVIP